MFVLHLIDIVIFQVNCNSPSHVIPHTMSWPFIQFSDTNWKNKYTKCNPDHRFTRINVNQRLITRDQAIKARLCMTLQLIILQSFIILTMCGTEPIAAQSWTLWENTYLLVLKVHSIHYFARTCQYISKYQNNHRHHESTPDKKLQVRCMTIIII